MHLMQYVGNADSKDQSGAVIDANGVAVIKGTLGEFDDHQIAVLSGMGMILVAIDDGGLSDMTAEQLKKRAEKEGVDKTLSKDDLVSALRASFVDSGEVRASMAIGGTPLTPAGDQPAPVSAQQTAGGTTTSTTTPSGSAT